MFESTSQNFNLKNHIKKFEVKFLVNECFCKF